MIHTKIGMSIQAVIFDFGNVLGFFDHHRATRKLAELSSRTEEEIFEEIYTTELEDALEHGRLSVPEFLVRLRETCALAGSDELLGRIFGDVFWENRDVCALVPRLKPKYRLVLGSNCTELHSRIFLAQFAETLRHFDSLVLSHEMKARKPAAAFYKECVRRAGCGPEQCVFIDDLAVNVAGADACGLQGIVYRHPEDLPAKLRALGIEFSTSST
jgi:FMN phosphatase YigB (HAD superfamily)